MRKTQSKFKTLSKLAKAFADGTLKREHWVLTLDNDATHLSWRGPLPEGIAEGSEAADVFYDEKDEEARAMYRGNGYSDLQEACEAAGIPCEWC